MLRVSENKAQLAGALSSESSLEQCSMLGDIVVRLYDETPIHRDNFIKLVKEGYYDGTLFHRVIKDFMIQGTATGCGDRPIDDIEMRITVVEN